MKERTKGEQNFHPYCLQIQTLLCVLGELGERYEQGERI